MNDDLDPAPVVDDIETGTVVGTRRSSVVRQTGFGWGLGVGALAVVAIMGTVALVLGVLSLQAMSQTFYPDSGPIAITPVEAGEPWFELAEDGTGVVEGWSYGSYGSNETNDYFFDVYEVGAVGEVPIQHVVSIQVDDDTEFFMGEEPYLPDGDGSAADAVFGDMNGFSSNGFIEGNLKLTIEVRVEDNRLIADKVTADPDSEPSPLFYF